MVFAVERNCKQFQRPCVNLSAFARWVAMAALWCLLLGGASLAAEDIPGPNRFPFLEPFVGSTRTPSSSMELVSVEVGFANSTNKRTALRVPRSYFVWVSEPGKNFQTFIQLAVYLPDYLPKALADKAGLQTRGEVINGIQLRSKAEIGIQISATVRVRGRSLTNGSRATEFLAEITTTDSRCTIMLNKRPLTAHETPGRSPAILFL